jgi:hypothetical protein
MQRCASISRRKPLVLTSPQDLEEEIKTLKGEGLVEAVPVGDEA